jgi:hypothetical protein
VGGGVAVAVAVAVGLGWGVALGGTGVGSGVGVAGTWTFTGAQPRARQVRRISAVIFNRVVFINSDFTRFPYNHKMTIHAASVEKVIAMLTAWCQGRADVRALALVGSYARGTARDDSDVDLTILCADPAAYRAGRVWLDALPWDTLGARVVETRDEEYGPLWSRFIFLSSGLEIEIGFSTPAWAAVDPVDPGTWRVIHDGCRILYDPEGLLARLVMAVNA